MSEVSKDRFSIVEPLIWYKKYEMSKTEMSLFTKPMNLIFGSWRKSKSYSDLKQDRDEWVKQKHSQCKSEKWKSLKPKNINKTINIEP